MGILVSTRRTLFGGGRDYSDRVLGYAPIAYWPLWEASGAVAADISGNGYNGGYTGVTLGQTGIGDGHTAPLFDGTNDLVDVYSAGFAAAFNGAEGTTIIWARVFNASVWMDGVARYAQDWRADNQNLSLISKAIANNRLAYSYEANNVDKQVDRSGVSETGWMCLGLTWSASADEVRAYYNGTQEGATQTSLGTWSGALNSISTCIGARATGPVNPWHGWLAHCAVWDAAQTPATMLDLATV